MIRNRGFMIRSYRRGWAEGGQGERWNVLIGAKGGALGYSKDGEKLARSKIGGSST